MSKTKWYDDICKELAGEHPEVFVKWILKEDVNREEIEILNTELSADIVHADFLIKVRGRIIIRHLVERNRAAGRRMKSYFQTETTRHDFITIKMWEQDLKEFLKVDWLTPFAVLAKTENRQQFFLEVRDVIEAIQDPEVKA